MAINIGARRAAKNQKRKAVVAEKRKAEVEANTAAGRVRQTLAFPIQHCLVSEGLFENGMGMVVLARGETTASVYMATFLLDTFALGVKDVFFRPIAGGEFAEYLRHMSVSSRMVPAEPAYARKLLRDLVVWARGNGIAPHRDFAKIEPIFGTVNADTWEIDFAFGHGGKPLIMGDPGDPRVIAAARALKRQTPEEPAALPAPDAAESA